VPRGDAALHGTCSVLLNARQWQQLASPPHPCDPALLLLCCHPRRRESRCTGPGLTWGVLGLLKPQVPFTVKTAAGPGALGPGAQITMVLQVDPRGEGPAWARQLPGIAVRQPMPYQATAVY